MTPPEQPETPPGNLVAYLPLNLGQMLNPDEYTELLQMGPLTRTVVQALREKLERERARMAGDLPCPAPDWRWPAELWESAGDQPAEIQPGPGCAAKTALRR